MAELLVELFSEEIPARMQSGAARDLERMAADGLKAAGLGYASLTTFAGPRRLTLVVDGLPLAQEDRVEERKGPRADAPEQAVAGFLRSTGLQREQLVERDGVLFAEIARPGRPTSEIAAELTDSIVRSFPWPKSMRWGTGTLRWIRPLKRIVLLFDGKAAPLDIDGIVSGDVTEGHRFMGSGKPFTVRDFADYREKLAREFVLLEADTRRTAILTRARQLCAAEGLELVEDEGLLEEVAGLAEHPVPILGRMDPAFLDLPPEVIRTSMRTHQKYFTVRDPKTGGLAPRFLAVANIEASDGGTAIAEGNARVLSARLNDARFFWDEDLKAGFGAWSDKLKGMMFHKKLGSMDQRVVRIAALARDIAPKVGADPDLAERAARLAKLDLASGMVGEFPELQGVMGGYYARRLLPAGPERDQIADAIRDHYKPVGPSDSVPTAPLTAAVSLADKLDMLTGFFAIDEKPTGSKDPYALRRAALGVIRIVLASGARVPVKPELLDFFADRLKVLLRDEGRRHDLVDAVFALGDDDIVRIVARVEALEAFLATEDGANLLAGYRRAVNILKAESKKDASLEVFGSPDAALFAEPEERALNATLEEALKAMGPLIEAEDFKGAMAALATLRAPVDAFFDKVLVNDPDPAVRMNRLRLLSRIEAAAGRVADFDRIVG